MPKTARQLDREIAEALGGSATTTAPRFTIHGARRGINEVKYAATPAEADHVARALAKKDCRMKFTVMDEDFARTARSPRAPRGR
jgi:hypothetical protein